MKIGWLLGWAIPEAWFGPLVQAALPTAAHQFFPADRDAMDRLVAATDLEHVVGYSLGAHLLLAAAARVSAHTPITLLAPIFAFPRERDLGGLVPTAQLRYLSRWLRRDPSAALRDFYARVGLDIPSELSATASVEDLAWGLDVLLEGYVPPQLPKSWAAVCGSRDPLLDANRLRALDPRIAILENATHHPAPLLAAMAPRIVSATAHTFA